MRKKQETQKDDFIERISQNRDEMLSVFDDIIKGRITPQQAAIAMRPHEKELRELKKELKKRKA